MSHVNHSNASEHSFVIRWQSNRVWVGEKNLLFVRQALGFGCFRLVIIIAGKIFHNPNRKITHKLMILKIILIQNLITNVLSLQHLNCKCDFSFAEEKSARKSFSREDFCASVGKRERRINGISWWHLLHNLYVCEHVDYMRTLLFFVRKWERCAAFD